MKLVRNQPNKQMQNLIIESMPGASTRDAALPTCKYKNELTYSSSIVSNNANSGDSVINTDTKHTAEYVEKRRVLQVVPLNDQQKEQDICNPKNTTLSFAESKKLFETNAPINLHKKEKSNVCNEIKTDYPVYGFPDLRETENFCNAYMKESKSNIIDGECTNYSDVWQSLRNASTNCDGVNANYIPAGVNMGTYLQAIAKKPRRSN